MKALFIGGTGTISAAVSRLCVEEGWELTLLNRGNRPSAAAPGARVISCDVTDESAVKAALQGERFDVVADFIAFVPEQVRRDIRLFEGRTRQYIFISSASAYQKPIGSALIDESTPLCNPYWQYSRDKIACEALLMDAYRESAFPVTIVRPSHTYDERTVVVGAHGPKGSFSVLERIRTGRKVIVPGDGLTQWTVTHSSDFAKGFCGLMGNMHAIGEAFNIVGDESLTWNQIYAAIGAALDVEPKLTHITSETLARLNADFYGSLLGDKSNNVMFDNRKIKRFAPKFVQTTRYDMGVRRSVGYIYSHPECQTPDPAFDAWTDAVIERYEALEAELPRFVKA